MTPKKSGSERPVIIAYKGFDKDLACHPTGGQRIQYEVGKTYRHDGPVTRFGAGGFHSCEYPLDVFGYYAPAGNRFALVEASGEIDRAKDDTKIASSVLTVKAELSLAGLIKAAVEYTTSRAKPVKGTSTRKAQGAASATGVQGAASATGIQGAASATGYRGAASATGVQGAASATGDRGAASATGYRGAASATGVQGAASATGVQGAASATGGLGAASATGYRGAASATGVQGAAMASGYGGKVMGNEGCALFLVERNEAYEIIAVWAGIAGSNGIKAGTWYTLSGGEPVEVTA